MIIYDEDNINHDYILRFIKESTTPHSGLLREMETYAKEHLIPISNIESMRMIEIIARSKGVKAVLEIGTAIGYSAIALAEAIDCSVVTIELNEEMVNIARKNIKLAGFEDKITVIHGDAREVLLSLPRTKKYDMIFMDAAKGQYIEFFNSCSELLKPNGLLISDNVLYKGMTANDELVIRRKITIVKRLREYLKMLKSHPGFDTVVLPVGDGIALSTPKRFPDGA